MPGPVLRTARRPSAGPPGDTHHVVYTRTRIVLDGALLSEAMEFSGGRGKREAVRIALEEPVARRRSRQLRALRGEPPIAPGCDVRSARRTMGGGPR